MALKTAVYPTQDCARVMGDGFSLLKKAFTAGTLSELPASFPAGSTAVVLDTATYYVAFSDNTWTEVSGGGGGLPEADIRLHKSFFSHNSLLPANTFMEALYDYPAPDFTNYNGATPSRSMSRMKFPSSSNPANWGWNLGAAKSTILQICGMMRGRSYNMGLFLSNSLPAAGQLPSGSYMAMWETSASRVAVYKVTAGPTYTAIATEGTVLNTDTYGQANAAMAYYYDDSTNRHIVFIKYGDEEWFPVIDFTDSTYTTFQYCGHDVSNNGGVTFYLGCPLAVYHN